MVALAVSSVTLRYYGMPPGTCAAPDCPKPVAQHATGRPARHCCTACGVRAHRQRNAAPLTVEADMGQPARGDGRPSALGSCGSAAPTAPSWSLSGCGAKLPNASPPRSPSSSVPGPQATAESARPPGPAARPVGLRPGKSLLTGAFSAGGSDSAAQGPARTATSRQTPHSTGAVLDTTSRTGRDDHVTLPCAAGCCSGARRQVPMA
jgi:hypothetical protein